MSTAQKAYYQKKNEHAKLPDSMKGLSPLSYKILQLTMATDFHKICFNKGAMKPGYRHPSKSYSSLRLLSNIFTLQTISNGLL